MPAIMAKEAASWKDGARATPCPAALERPENALVIAFLGCTLAGPPYDSQAKLASSSDASISDQREDENSGT